MCVCVCRKSLLLVNFLLGGEPVIMSFKAGTLCVCVDSMCKCIDPEVYSTHTHSTVLC